MVLKQTVWKAKNCRVCKSRKLAKVLTLGPTPLANAFLNKQQLDVEEKYFPLDVYFCVSCSMVQLGHIVDPRILFGNYVYVSSTSPVFIKHFTDFAKYVFHTFGLDRKSLVIDIGSNDGILLKPFAKLGARVLGIEPADTIAKVAQKEGINTIVDFFSQKIAHKIVQNKGKANIITATNVFAHIDDLDEVIKGIKTLLTDDGVFIMEAPYLIDFIQRRYFDLVYHEHLSYWAIAPLITLFKRFDMKVFAVEKVSAHGGSIRVFIAKNTSRYKEDKSVKKFLEEEKKAKLANIDTYKNYASDILENKANLITILTSLKMEGKKIAGYGAPAKGNTLLNFFGIGTEILEYIIDDSPWKQGLYSPGKRIPVVPSQQLDNDNIDYMLILAWNFAESIMAKNVKFSRKGGHFIIPVPKPIVI